MANRRLYQFHAAYEAQTVKLWMNVAIGSSGAPTLTDNENKGIASITRNSTGNYTIDLVDSFNRLLAAQMVSLSASTAAAPEMTVLDDSSSDSTAPSIQIETSSGGIATDPGSGEVLLIELTMKNSSV